MALVVSQDREIEELKRQLGQAEKELHYMRSYCFAVRRNIDSVAYIMKRFSEGDIPGAAEAWYEIEPKDRNALYRAPTKGGFLTTKQRALMKTEEFRP